MVSLRQSKGFLYEIIVGDIMVKSSYEILYTRIPALWDPVHAASKRQARSLNKDREQYYTPEFTKVKFHRKVPVNVHWTFRETIHWESGNPLESTADMWNSLENAAESPLENSTENPR